MRIASVLTRLRSLPVRPVVGGALAVYVCIVLYESLVRTPGPHDNDWTLLSWLAQRGSPTNPAPWVVGHYGFLQLALVRGLLPMCGSTLVAAKILNAMGMAVLGAVAFAMVARFTKFAAWGAVSAALFLLWPSVFMTGQSEFGDPLAMALYATGLWFATQGRRAVTLMLAGLLFGMAGWTRLHLQMFSLASLTVIAAYYLATLPRALAFKRAATLGAATLIAQAPLFAMNMTTHGTLFSPIARGFVGEVLFGADAYDMPGTHMLHPFDEVLREHKLALLDVITDRLLQVPLPALLGLVICLVGLIVVREKSAPLALILILALGYYIGFVTPSWGLTHRLLMPFIFFSATGGVLGAAVMVEHFASMQVTQVAIVLGLLVVAVNVRSGRWFRRGERANIDNYWSRNQAIDATLRDYGMNDPLQVFAVDWWTHPTRDPQFIPYYNFGFWNLLVPEFAEERPNPRPYVYEPEKLLAFLLTRGVRYLVLTTDSPFTPLNALTERDELSAGFRRIARVDNQVIFAKMPVPQTQPGDGHSTVP